jgi:hypothetical protein
VIVWLSVLPGFEEVVGYMLGWNREGVGQ